MNRKKVKQPIGGWMDSQVLEEKGALKIDALQTYSHPFLFVC